MEGEIQFRPKIEFVQNILSKILDKIYLNKLQKDNFLSFTHLFCIFKSASLHIFTWKEKNNTKIDFRQAKVNEYVEIKNAWKEAK